MSRRSRGRAFDDTINPELVRVSCEGCGDSFTTNESTAYAADQNGDDLLCDDCEAGGQPAPPQAALEEPPIDAVHDDLGVGPDAEPELEATIPDRVGFNEIVENPEFRITLTKGTEEIGTILLRVLGAQDRFLRVRLNPGPEALSEAAVAAIITVLSRHTNLLIKVE